MTFAITLALRSKRFRDIQGQRITAFGSSPNFARAKYRSGSVPWSFFAPQIHGNVCYAGCSVLEVASPHLDVIAAPFNSQVMELKKPATATSLTVELLGSAMAVDLK